MNTKCNTKCYPVSWEKIPLLIGRLARKIRKNFQPDIVIGIARGGLVPARCICDHLLVRELAIIHIKHWGTAKTLGEAKVTIPLSQSLENKKVLIVDDVADTGETLKKAIEHLEELKPSEIRTAVLHYKTSSILEPDYYTRKMAEWKWIIYPWALREDLFHFLKEILKQEELSDRQINRKLHEKYGLKLKKEELTTILTELEETKHLEKTKTPAGRKWKLTHKALEKP